MSSVRASNLLALTVLAMVFAGGCGSSDDVRTVTETVTVTTGAVDDDQAEVDDPEQVECSALDLDEVAAIDDPAALDLPDEVVAARDEIRLAAANCDFAALGELADHDRFAYEEGSGDPAAFADYARRVDADQQLAARIVQLLALPSTIVDGGPDGEPIYVWPSAFSDDAGDDDWTALEASGAYPVEQLEAFRDTGGYLGYRIGVLADGTWLYLAAGD